MYDQAIDILARTALVFVQQWFIIPLIIIGYFTRHRAVFCRALFLLLFTMIFNPFLKSIWQIPLLPHLNSTGFAFPSGHMQTAVAFWGWLAWEFRRQWLFIGITLLLPAIGFALVRLRYHLPLDIWGAVFFAVLCLPLYYLLCRALDKIRPNQPSYIGMVLLIFTLPFIFFMPRITPGAWIALGAWTGFIIGCSLDNRLAAIYKMRKSYFALCLAFLGVAGLVGLFRYLQPLVSLPILNFMQFFFISVWISFAADYLTSRKA